MNRIKLLSIFTSYILCWTPAVQAAWTSRNRVEAGMTDNALWTDINRENDFFLGLGTTSSTTKQGHNLGFRLSYQDYGKVNENDALSWGLFDKIACVNSSTHCAIQLKGQQYVYQEPQTTDSSFSNYGLATSIENSRSLPSDLSLDLTGGYEFKNYHSQNRSDHIVNGEASLGYEVTPRLYLEATGDLGLNLSSASEFSYTYLELIFFAEYSLTNEWSASGGLSLKQSSFLSRDLSTETLVTRRSGKTVLLTDITKESYSTVGLTLEATKTLSLVHSLGIRLQTYNQKSRSGYQDYNVNELIGQWLFHF